MSNLQLSVGVNEDLGFKYPCQIRLVDKVEIKGCRVLICKFIKSENIVRISHRWLNKNHLNFFFKYIYIYIYINTKSVSEKMGIVRAVSLNLNTPPGVPSYIEQ